MLFIFPMRHTVFPILFRLFPGFQDCSVIGTQTRLQVDRGTMRRLCSLVINIGCRNAASLSNGFLAVHCPSLMVASFGTSFSHQKWTISSSDSPLHRIDESWRQSRHIMQSSSHRLHTQQASEAFSECLVKRSSALLSTLMAILRSKQATSHAWERRFLLVRSKPQIM